ncbi:auxin-responsive protein SAUR71-like [Euphorbia lathyris]|uniref:auxin-responsive protein SAUR71-like n=1 Tax=Euphorbia lathyris TaxID=212925 RepID=UPI00331339D3
MSGILRKMWCCGAKGFESQSQSQSEMMRRRSEDEEEDEIREGYIRVYVGKEFEWKLEMEANFLNHPLFEDLLRLSEEEFGFSYDGALRIACDVHLFEYLLHLLKTSNPSAHYMQLSDLISNFHSKYSPSSSS